MSIEQLEQAAAGLGPLREKVAFLGAAAIVLWISDPAAPPLRPTKDVDLIVEVGSLVDYYRLGEQLRELRFEENPDAHRICAWRHRDTRVELDVMPTDPEILGFANDWYPAALGAAVERTLPSGTRIRAVPPPYLLATKIEAFLGRGGGDFLGSQDFGDLVVLTDGRSELVDEVRAAPSGLREYLAQRLGEMQENFAFATAVSGMLMPDIASQARAPLVLERIQRIIDSV